jgi:phosphoenolpyruvate phosphomutase / 2-hydroxyethylphosphonate cytidylyltransferase
MKAIILASGVGRRLRPLTDRYPKSLLRVGGKTLIDYQLEALAKHGVCDIVITTGHLGKKLEEHVRKTGVVPVQFVHNAKYESTNYIYSLWLTKGLVDDDIILLHGDLIFDSVLIRKLLEAQGNRVLVNRYVLSPEKDFKALIKRGRVVRIGVNLSGPGTFFCAPMYKFSKADFLLWLDKIEDFVRQGKVDCYAEDALNEISDDVLLGPLYFKEFCMEIDTKSDLEKTRKHLQSESGRAGLWPNSG